VHPSPLVPVRPLVVRRSSDIPWQVVAVMAG